MRKNNYILLLYLFIFSLFVWSVAAIFLAVETKLNIVLIVVLIAHSMLATLINNIMFSQIVRYRITRKNTLRLINTFIVLYSIILTLLLYLLNNLNHAIPAFNKQSIFISPYLSGYVSYLILQIFSFYLFSCLNLLSTKRKYKTAAKTFFITGPCLIVNGVFYIITLNQYIVNYSIVVLLILITIPLFKYSNEKHKINNLKAFG